MNRLPVHPRVLVFGPRPMKQRRLYPTVKELREQAVFIEKMEKLGHRVR